MKKLLLVIAASLFANHAFSQCSAYLVTDIQIPTDTTGMMDITFVNNGDFNVYLSVWVITQNNDTIVAYDDCQCFAVPPHGLPFTSRFNTTVTSLPPPGTYRIAISNGTLICDSLAFNPSFVPVRADCNNLYLDRDTFFISFQHDTVTGNLLYFDSVVLYQPHTSLILSDTTIITASANMRSAILGFNPSDTIAPFRFKINFKTIFFPHNTIVNGFYHIFMDSPPDTVVSCHLPVTIVLQNPTVCDIYDTTTVTVYDTVEIPVYDTTHVTVNDTASITVYDTATVTVFDSVSVSDTLVINVNLTGIPPDDLNTIKVYPNPAFDHIYIDNGSYSLMSNYSLKITNETGQIAFQSSINQQLFYIDLNTFGAHGTFFLTIFNPQNQVETVRKIILQ